MVYRYLLPLLALLIVGCTFEEKPHPVKKSLTLPIAHKSTHPPQLILLPPSREVYTLHPYARFFYEKDCRDLLFRKHDLYQNEMKYDPMSVIEIGAELDREIKKRGCQ